MEHHRSGVVDEHAVVPDDAVQHVEIAATRKRHAGIERLVEPTQFEREAPPERHVATGAEHSRAIWIQRVVRSRLAKIPNGLVSATKPPESFEGDLSIGVEFRREDLAAHCSCVGVRAPRASERAQPGTIEDDVVVDEGDDLTGRFGERPVASDVQTWRGFFDVTGTEVFSAGLGAMVTRSVVDDEDFRWLRRKLVHRLKTTSERLRPVLGADRHRDRGLLRFFELTTRLPAGICWMRRPRVEQLSYLRRREHRSRCEPVQRESDDITRGSGYQRNSVLASIEFDRIDRGAEFNGDNPIGHGESIVSVGAEDEGRGRVAT